MRATLRDGDLEIFWRREEETLRFSRKGERVWVSERESVGE